jgi:hypothetical protein
MKGIFRNYWITTVSRVLGGGRFMQTRIPHSIRAGNVECFTFAYPATLTRIRLFRLDGGQQKAEGSLPTSPSVGGGRAAELCVVRLCVA